MTSWVRAYIPGFSRGGVPLVVEPRRDTSLDGLVSWIADEREVLAGYERTHGAVLFRGFDVTSPEDFERVALAVRPDLKNDYLGTSPRDAVTTYVFSASELPPFYPIPQHCEMSFTANPPERLFFYCDVAPRSRGGETPLVDFSRVYETIRADVRQEFERRGLRIIRNYSGPGSQDRDLWKLKPWHEMFGTTDREAVTARAIEEGFEPIWRDDDRLTLLSEQPAVRRHPESGVPVWFNHSQVFHLTTASSELLRAGLVDLNVRSLALAAFAGAMVAVRRRVVPAELQAMHCTFRDGGEIPDAMMAEVRNAIWRNLIRYRWQRGDAIVIDNFRVSHGRMPYSGPRRVLVAWA